jgi:hypothetical protein
MHDIDMKIMIRVQIGTDANRMKGFPNVGILDEIIGTRGFATIYTNGFIIGNVEQIHLVKKAHSSINGVQNGIVSCRIFTYIKNFGSFLSHQNQTWTELTRR